MILVVFDPALLIYSYSDWVNGGNHCLNRMQALSLHREIITRYRAVSSLIISNDYLTCITNSFPWNDQYKNISELRDLRQFLLIDLSSAINIDIVDTPSYSIDDNSLCFNIENDNVINAFVDLLISCKLEQECTDNETVILSWHNETDDAGEIVCEPSLDKDEIDTLSQLSYTIIRERNIWFNTLSGYDFWPNIHLCVEVFFESNPSYSDYQGSYDVPLEIEATNSFLKSIKAINVQSDRKRLIKAITKRAYGILDSSLGDEAYEKVRRFRVTDFWRVHYDLKDNTIMLLEYGPHDM